ncbi:MAG TPA: SDR family NAD(P)-dependent oxidoreductase, partial [Afifellaceae bacterium]|nr:SDR family NAD(P)-dependent oxidoreductase [Afifellaceae bacterium]
MSGGRLAGKVAIVTGGGRSLGLAFAGALAGEGAAIVIADLDDASDAAGELTAAHSVEALSIATDVSDEAHVTRLAEQSMARFGRVDVLVNNAALFAQMPLKPYDQIDVELWDRVMAVNVRGAFLTAKHVAPHMVRAGSGKIVNIGSGTAYKGMPEMLAYVASKAAILGLTRSLARELGPHGICVNTLAPGLTESESLQENPHHLAFTERVVRSRAMPRRAVPEDLLGALVFLASSDSDF